MAIKCNNWIIVERYKKEREEYENYTSNITKEKILFAKSKVDKTDLKILSMIHKLKLCTSIQLTKIIYKDEKYGNRYMNNKLRKLFTIGCIDRFFPAREKGTYPTHVVLAPIGAKLIDVSGFKKITFINQKWRHTVSTNEVLANLLYKYKVKFAKMEMWVENNEDFKIRTDMFSSWIQNDKPMFAFFEIDMGTENMSDVTKKVEIYHKYFNSTYFSKATWQPYREKEIAIIPKIIFIFNEETRSKKFDKFISNYESNVKFSTQTFENLDL